MVILNEKFGHKKTAILREIAAKYRGPSSLVNYSFVTSFVRNRNFFTAFLSSRVQHPSTCRRFHTLAETVFVSALSIRWLKCSFTHH